MTREPVVYDLWADIREEWLTLSAYEGMAKLMLMAHAQQAVSELCDQLFGPGLL